MNLDSNLFNQIVVFLFQLLISSIIVYAGAKLMSEKEKFVSAMLAAFIGSIIYSLIYLPYVPIIDLGKSILAFLGWLTTLKTVYKTSWARSLTLAIIIWFLSLIFGWIFPTLPGPF